MFNLKAIYVSTLSYHETKTLAFWDDCRHVHTHACSHTHVGHENPFSTCATGVQPVAWFYWGREQLSNVLFKIFLSYTGTRTPNYKLQTFVSAGQQCKSCVATALSLCTPLSHRCVSNPRMTYTVRMIRGDQPLASPTIIVILEVMLKFLASNSQRVGQHASLRGYA